MADSDSPIVLDNVSKRFGDLIVLDGVSLTLPRACTTAIIGPSGTGKSVLLKHIVGLLKPDSGSVKVFGVDMGRARERDIYATRKRIGMLFQDGALFDSFNVGENIAFPLVQHHPKMSKEERREKVEKVLEMVELPGLYERATAALSGGQRKRVGLARAIVTEPEIVLFDEPNSGLDPMTSDAIDNLICHIRDAMHVTFVVISHDIVGTVNVADHIAMLYGGKVVAWGTTDEVTHSDHPMVRRFLGRNLMLPEAGTLGSATLPRIG